MLFKVLTSGIGWVFSNWKTVFLGAAIAYIVASALFINNQSTRLSAKENRIEFLEGHIKEQDAMVKRIQDSFSITQKVSEEAIEIERKHSGIAQELKDEIDRLRKEGISIGKLPQETAKTPEGRLPPYQASKNGNEGLKHADKDSINAPLPSSLISVLDTAYCTANKSDVHCRP